MLCITLSPMITLLTHIYWLCISAISAWLLMHAMEYLIQISRQHFKRWLMLFSCWLLTNVVIQIGDSFNILATLPCFLAIIFFACEGRLWKKLTVGAMYASTIFSFNALRDNFLKYPFRTQTYTNLYIYLQATTKTDKKNHGLGLKGIKEIVTRYHGDMELKKEDGIFELFLYIPLQSTTP